jgi:NADPH2:quinone reductase
MKAIVVEKFGTPATFRITDRPDPRAGPGQSVVRLRAAAVNPLDLTVQAGHFPMAKQPPLVLGNEGAGQVEQSSKFKPGTRVIVAGGTLGVGSDGTLQERIAVADKHLIPLPESYGFEEGAAFAVAYLTGYGALLAAGTTAGDFVAIPGATGSVGYATVQIANALGAKPIAIVSTDAKAAEVQAGKPAGVVDMSKESLADGVLRASGGHGADVAVDGVGGSGLGALLHALAPGGRAVSLGYAAGIESTINLLDLIAKPSRLIGFNLYAIPGEEIGRWFAQLGAWTNAGKLRPHIDSTHAFADYAQAFARLSSRKAMGKVIIKL